MKSTSWKYWRKRTVNLDEDRLVRWLLLLEAAEDDEIRDELETIAKEDPAMKEAFEKWEDISRDPKALAEYHSRRMAILDEAAAIRETELQEQKARKAAIREVAKRMLDAIKISRQSRHLRECRIPKLKRFNEEFTKMHGTR